MIAPVKPVYARPRYFEVIYNFRDLAAEVAAMKAIIDRYGEVGVHRVLELGCGTAPHLPEFVRRGYHYVGLDLSAAMLAYAQQRADRLGLDRVTLVEGDLVDFEIAPPVDFTMSLLGSLYVQSTDELKRHFDSVARALRPGGLYLLDWAISFDETTEVLDGWSSTEGDLTIGVTYESHLVNATEQVVKETLTLEVDDAGRHETLQQVALQRVIYPQEFLFFLETRPDFEFIGWWEEWDLDAPLDGVETSHRPIVVVRRV